MFQTIRNTVRCLIAGGLAGCASPGTSSGIGKHDIHIGVAGASKECQQTGGATSVSDILSGQTMGPDAEAVLRMLRCQIDKPAEAGK